MVLPSMNLPTYFSLVLLWLCLILIISSNALLKREQSIVGSTFDKALCYFLDISQETALHPSDIISTLQYLGILKYWKGKHVILRATVSVTQCKDMYIIYKYLLSCAC